jgi:hypothetical protein
MAEYRVVRADLEGDKNDILSVWERSYGYALRAETLPWFYKNCPHGPGRIWLLVADPGKCIVGTSGVGLRRVKVGGTAVLAGLGAGFAVVKEHQFLLPALFLAKAGLRALREELAFVYACPTNPAIGVLQLAGFKPAGTMKRYVKVLRVEPYLNKLPVLSKGTRILGPVLNLWLSMTSGRWQWRWRRHVFRQVCDIDGRFDALWERAAHRYSMILERKAQYLRWRFTEYPHAKRCLDRVLVVALMTRDEQHLVGYAAYYMVGDRAILIDLFAEDMNEALAGVLGGLTRWLRRRGASCAEVECFGPTELVQSLRQAGFVYRKSKSPERVVVTSSIVGGGDGKQTSESLDWYFMTADTSSN